MEWNKPKLIILMDLAQELITAGQIPLYGSKHSKKDFDNHQLFKLLVLKAIEGKDYRRFCESLEVSIIPDYLGLKRIPHFTTLQKFAQRQNIQKLEKLLLQFIDLSSKKMKNGGVDASFFRLSHASEHYEKRIGRPIKKKDFLKSTFFFDLDNQLILAVKMRKKKRHDMHDMKFLWNKIKDILFEYFYGDKAFDANWLHKLIFESGRKSMIHMKQEDIPIWRTSGQFRKQAKKLAPNKKKGKRSIVEVIISIVKRVFSAVLRARTLTNQKIEFLFRIIACNLESIYRFRKNIFLFFYFLLGFLASAKKSSLNIGHFSPISC